MTADEIGPNGKGSLRKNTGPRAEESEKPYLRALLRDPQTVFLYWDLEGDATKTATWLLRIDNISTGESRSVEIDPDTHRHYAEVSPGCTHRFSIGTAEDDSFTPVCTSEDLEVPASEIGDGLSAKKAETLFGTGHASSPHSGDFAGSSDIHSHSSKSIWPQTGEDN